MYVYVLIGVSVFSVGGMIHSKPFSQKICVDSVGVPAVGIFMGGAPTPIGKS